MAKSPSYCVMPHLGMALQNHSDFCCCNVNKASWKDRQKEVMHVYSHPVEISYQSHTRKMIAAALDHGIKHESCRACWDLEEAGAVSSRQTFNQMFGELDILSDQPRVLIIKPGNTCNFACRMCNPITSSSWYADGYALEHDGLTSPSWYDSDQRDSVAALTFNQYTRTFENIRNSFNRDNEGFWNTLKRWIENLVFIDIYGGEPFLTPALWDLLEHGVSIGSSKNITLSLHTNASIFNQRYLDILSHYKQVTFHVSIDSDIPAQLEYIRHKAEFDTVIENSKRFRDFVRQHPNIQMMVTYTVTPLNVYYVDQAVPNLRSMLDLGVGTNLVTTSEYDIRHLPQSVKKLLVDRISDSVVVNFLQQVIPGCDVEWPRFCQITDRLDQLRGQSFAQTFPEWWKILEPHWVTT